MIELETRPETAPETPPRPKTPQETLLAAARYIEEHGWCQGSEQTADGRVCAMGALNAVVGGGDGWDEEERWSWAESMAKLGATIGHRAFDVPGWNDEHGRTEAEVIAALRKAATL